MKAVARARSRGATSTGLRTGLVRRLFEFVENEFGRRRKTVEEKCERQKVRMTPRLATSETGA